MFEFLHDLAMRYPTKCESSSRTLIFLMQQMFLQKLSSMLAESLVASTFAVGMTLFKSSLDNFKAQ